MIEIFRDDIFKSVFLNAIDESTMIKLGAVMQQKHFPEPILKT